MAVYVGGGGDHQNFTSWILPHKLIREMKNILHQETKLTTGEQKGELREKEIREDKSLLSLLDSKLKMHHTQGVAYMSLTLLIMATAIPCW